MARITLIHWDGPEGRERRRRLVSFGYDVDFDDVDGIAPVLRKARANPPDAVVIDLSRLPSHGRETALSLRSSKATRLVPLVFVDGEPEKVARIRTTLPDATYTTWGRLKAALPRAIAKPPANPVVPKDATSGKPAVEKLGIKEGMRVALVGAPPGFARTLEPFPPKVKLTAKVDDRSHLVLCVTRSARELSAHFVLLGQQVDRQTLWAIWPKRASGVQSDLDGNVVREMGLATGWIDFKVCAVDATWSGLAFKRRR